VTAGWREDVHFAAVPFDCNEIFTDRGVKKHGEPKLPVLATTLTDDKAPQISRSAATVEPTRVTFPAGGAADIT